MTDNSTNPSTLTPGDLLWIRNSCTPPPLRPNPQKKWITGPCQMPEYSPQQSQLDTESDAITQRMNARREKYDKMSLKDLKEESELILKENGATSIEELFATTNPN